MPDARCTRDLVSKCAQGVRPRAYRAAENTRHSLRNGFTAYFVLSPENGSFASVAPLEAIASRCIDASTATSGPHAFAVRLRRARQAQHQRPPHPRPTFVTCARPSDRDGIPTDVPVIWVSGKEKFCPSCQFVAPGEPSLLRASRRGSQGDGA